jgi:hypothetical protein
MATAEATGAVPATAAFVEVEVVFCPAPGVADRTPLRLPRGATVAQALEASGLAQRYALDAGCTVGIWGRAKPPETPLRDRDRVEVYRALTVDPKEARRLRYKRQREPR